MRWLLDTNVLLDVLADREPWVEHSARVLERVERGEATGYVAAHAVTTLFYLVARARGSEGGRKKTRTLLRLLEVVPVDQERLLHALDLPLDDYEDAVHAACAVKADVDALVTRNEEDFTGTGVEVLSPVELLARWGDD